MSWEEEEVRLLWLLWGLFFFNMIRKSTYCELSRETTFKYLIIIIIITFFTSSVLSRGDVLKVRSQILSPISQIWWQTIAKLSTYNDFNITCGVNKVGNKAAFCLYDPICLHVTQNPLYDCDWTAERHLKKPWNLRRFEN